MSETGNGILVLLIGSIGLIVSIVLSVYAFHFFKNRMLSMYYKKRIGSMFIDRDTIMCSRHPSQNIKYVTIEEVMENKVLYSQDWYNKKEYHTQDVDEFYKRYKITDKISKSTAFQDDLDKL
jgi:hypothetical protein